MKILTLAAVLPFLFLLIQPDAHAVGGPRFRFVSYPQSSPNNYILADSVVQDSRSFGFNSFTNIDCNVGNVVVADATGHAVACATVDYYGREPFSRSTCSTIMDATVQAGGVARHSVYQFYGRGARDANWREQAQVTADAAYSRYSAEPGNALAESTFPIEVGHGGGFASVIPQRVVSQRPARHRATFSAPAASGGADHGVFHADRLDIYGYHTKFELSLSESSAAARCIFSAASGDLTLRSRYLPEGGRILGVITSVTYATALVAHLTDVRVNSHFEGQAGGLSSLGLIVHEAIWPMRSSMSLNQESEGRYNNQGDLIGFSIDTNLPPMPLWLELLPVKP